MEYKLGDILEQVYDNNNDLKYGLNDIVGVTIEKKIIPTIANLSTTDLRKFIIVKPSYFIYNPRTHGKKIGLGYNDTKNEYIATWNNNVFKIKDNMTNIIDSDYLYIYFNRDIWDKEACFNAWGSSTVVLLWNDFCNMKIELPSIAEQRRIVDIYKTISCRIDLLNNIIEKGEQYCSKYFNILFSFEENEDKFGNYVSYMQGNQMDLDEQYLQKKDNMVRFLRIVDYTNSSGYEPPRYVKLPTNATYTSEDEISIVRYGSLGTICRRKEGIIANNLFKIIPNKIVGNNFIYYYLKQNNIQHLIKNSEGNSVMSAIKHSTISELPMPKYKENDVIKFEKVADNFEKQFLNYSKEIEILKKYRTILISTLS